MRNQSSGFWEEYGPKPESEAIGGRVPPRVELAAQFDSTREKSPCLDTVRIDRSTVLS